METSQKPRLLHDDGEALALIERIKQMKLAEQNARKKAREAEKNSRAIFRLPLAQN